jgi:hypothetical protein
MFKAFLLTIAGAALGLAQGALSPNSSYFNAPTYPSVTRVGAGHNNTGWLAFEPTNEVRFVPKAGEEIRIPYRAIKELQYEKTMAQTASNTQTRKKSKFALPVKMNFVSKHQLTINYEAAYGPESATLWLDPSNYQSVLGTLHSKTGLTVKRQGENAW